MNWYVKFEGTGVISGPMSHEKAEYYAEAAVGLVFSEAVFEQEEVVNFPSKVEDLLKDLHLHVMPLSVGKDYNLDNRLSSLCQRAIDTITNLSREKVVRGTIQGGVLSLEDVPAGVTVDIKDYDCEGVDEENLNKDETGTHFQAG